jgi:NitT/TauT family transport system ATP-binding protein
MGVTLVVVTHNIEEAVFLGDRILVLSAPTAGPAYVIENAGAGGLGYRGQATYWAKCAEVRAALAQAGVIETDRAQT